MTDSIHKDPTLLHCLARKTDLSRNNYQKNKAKITSKSITWITVVRLKIYKCYQMNKTLLKSRNSSMDLSQTLIEKLSSPLWNSFLSYAKSNTLFKSFVSWCMPLFQLRYLHMYWIKTSKRKSSMKHFTHLNKSPFPNLSMECFHRCLVHKLTS